MQVCVSSAAGVVSAGCGPGLVMCVYTHTHVLVLERAVEKTVKRGSSLAGGSMCVGPTWSLLRRSRWYRGRIRIWR